MPYYSNSSSGFDAFKARCIGVEYKFVFLPKKCHLTGAKLWLKMAYKQTAMWTGPGEAIFEHRWYDADQFILAKIAGKV